MKPILPDSVRALANADFSRVGGKFAAAGLTVCMPERGVMQIEHPARSPSRMRLLLSAGVHGDETAPIEILAHLLDGLSVAPRDLATDLLVVLGNPDAIARGSRYVDADLNRMFRTERGDLASAAEAERADAIMRATAAFFGSGATVNWHLDLHTAIRPSHYPAFAVIPGVIAEERAQAILQWLGRAGIGAAILGTHSAGTYSAWTAARFGAMSATLELGQVGAIGSNDLSRFDDARAAVDDLVRTGVAAPGECLPRVFLFRQELVKRSDAFRLAFDRNAKNFSAIPPGEIIAEDGDMIYRVGSRTEYVVFPNPEVRVGLRAGLTVVPTDGD